MKVLSIIPARGGSKGIPLKNLTLLNGKPLLYYTAIASLNSKLINRTVVSTEHKEIAKEAKLLGAEVINRPKRLANDHAAIEPVVQHALEYLHKKHRYVPDIIVILSVTSPLRTAKHIDEALTLLIEKKYDSVLSGCSFHTFLWKVQKNSTVKPISYDPQKRPNRQEIDIPLLENGAIFATTYNSFRKSKCRISGKIGFYDMPIELSHNIDSSHDLFAAEQLIKKQNVIDELFSVKNKNIILTGSSGLLGSYYARVLLERGANLALIDHNPKVSESIKNQFSHTGQNVQVYKCDLSKPRQIILTFKKILKDFASIDVLINNAAFGSRQTLHIKDFKNYETHPFSLWREAFKVNIDAIHLCTQQVIGLMKKQKHGVIINVSSVYGVVGPDFDTYENEKLWTPPGYAVTKSAVLNFTRYIANLYGKYNIRCNTITPSGVATENLPKSFIKKYSSRNAFKRMAKPSDYVGPIVFLCSDASGYMTGANLIVDGGWTAR